MECNAKTIVRGNLIFYDFGGRFLAALGTLFLISLHWIWAWKLTVCSRSPENPELHHRRILVMRCGVQGKTALIGFNLPGHNLTQLKAEGLTSWLWNSSGASQCGGTHQRGAGGYFNYLTMEMPRIVKNCQEHSPNYYGI